jgi:PAT family beta-lactamase induction signal transducer AmpG
MVRSFRLPLFLVAFFAASQDIVIDAYRRDVLPDNELGLGSSFAVNGYRVALLISGAGALALADHMAWRYVYLIMAAVLVVAMLVTLFSPEPNAAQRPPKNLRDAVVLPFTDFLGRPYAVEILIFILVFKIGDSMASDMFNPFYIGLGFTKTQIAAIAKVFGFWATIGGGLLGGLAMVRIGIPRSLWIFGILQTVSTLGFSVLAHVGNSLSWLTGIVVFENLCTGMASAAYVGFMSALCNRNFTATQFALLSSLMGVPRVILGSSSGYFAKHLGWGGYFLFCGMLHAPGLLLLLRQQRWQQAVPKD